MRMPREIDDEGMRAARERGLAPQTLPSVQMEHGIPVWKHGPGAVPVTNELIRSLGEGE
jgi:hypothetical protein